MLQRKPEGNAPIRTYGFLVGVEIEDEEATPEEVAMKISDALTFMEGTGAVEVSVLGEIDIVAEPVGNA